MTTERFESFSTQHYLLVGIFLLGIPVLVWLGRRHRGTAGEVVFRRSAAVVVAIAAITMQAYQLTPDDYSLQTSLPLQLCDLATVAAVVALWTRGPRAAAFTYYVGLTLTIQGILTPSLAEGFPHPRFFGFWVLHYGVVWTAIYLTWGLGLHPTWRRYWFSVAVTAAWAAAVFGFNVIADTNYGYLNGKPSSGSALDYLGPWPWYVLVEVALVALVWAAVLTWPWQWRSNNRSDDRARAHEQAN